MVKALKSMRVGAALAIVLPIGLAACGEGVESEARYPTKIGPNRYDPTGRTKPGDNTLFGPGGADIFGGDEDDVPAGSGIAVNSFLWRASLDTLSFMPLASADPFGGVIITDWHTPAEVPNERFKATVYILDRRLRADGLRVSVFRQVNNGTGWQDAPVAEDTSVQLEDTILTRARELRVRELG